MIVEPSFFHHWKTRLLVTTLGNAGAPLAVLRLWAHCQERKTHKLKLSPDALASVCEWPEDPKILRQALITCGFLDEEANCLVVHDWDKQNWYLINAWKNGRKHRTHGIPTGNPSRNPQVTHPSNLIISNPVQKKGEVQEGNGAITAEAIFQAYPRKEGKAEALREISKRIKEGKEPRFLLERVKLFSRATSWKERRYIPLPATWFHQGRFDDDESCWYDPTKPIPRPKSKALEFI